MTDSRLSNATPEGLAPGEERGDVYVLPLSFAQQRLWFLDQITSGSPFYNVPLRLRLSGSLDVPALEKTLHEIVRRHEVLRTTFSSVDGEPVQQVATSLAMPLPVVDLREFPDAEEKAKAWAAEEAHEPFDLSRGPLLRVKLLRLGERKHDLLLTMHHIVTDGWSLGVLYRELATLYLAFSSGKPSPLPDLPIQYADFAHWQREWLRGGILEKQLSYWKERLAGLTPLELPTDRARPAMQSFRGTAQSVLFPKPLAEGLKALSLREGVTLFMTLLAGFQTLLHRYTAQEDIAIGSPIANRNRTEIEGLIGFFVNSLVMRTDFSGNPTFRELLQQVREVTLGAYAHQDLPFEKLVEEIHPERSLSQNPVFQMMFTLQDARWVQTLMLPDLTVRPLESETCTTHFDLEVELLEKTDGLQCSFVYSTDLFDAETIERMMAHFWRLLEEIVSNLETRVGDLRMLAGSERHQLLEEWNGAVSAYPRDKCIQELFEAQVEQTPEAVAVVFEQDQLTYRELNRSANQLAHYLKKLGVGVEVPVAMCLERSLDMVLSTLAILKAGGAYVPLDSDYPRERLEFMLEDTRSPVLLTQSTLLEKLPSGESRVVCIDTDRPLIARESTENPTVATQPENLAYVIYTSGSTGRPKGVMVEHRAVVRLVKGTHYAHFGPDEIFLQLATISFDASTFEIWGALLNGARLVVMPVQTPSLEELGRAIRQYGVTTLWLTAGLFHLMVEQRLEDLKPLGQLLAGGDALSPPHVRKVLQGLEQGTLINGYGPTENTTFTCCHAMKRGDVIGDTVPLGRPISNTQVYLLDSHLQPVPVGVPGELCAGGDGLARGYLHQPELTAEKFVPHPFSSEPGARLYRTGDLARYRRDGTIEFLGRSDQQVKIRGFRIELGEIEAVLRQHAAVAEAVVVAREDQPGDKRLAAYVVPQAQAEPGFAELRNFLKAKLPDYMVPSSFVRLEAFPLTPNGKVDRRALPAPEGLQLESGQGFVAPRTPLEEVLVGIWAEVLGREHIGIHDNFFDLGGHSLLATRVTSRLREALYVELPLRRLFELPTVAGLAECIASAQSVGSHRPTPPLQPVARDKDLPLSFGQQRLWFLYQLEEDKKAYNISHAVRLEGPLNRTALEQSLQAIVRRHEILRTSFPLVEGQPIQSVAPSLPFSLPVTDLRSLSEAERQAQLQHLIREEAQRAFILSQGPLWRAALFQCGDEDHVLVFTFHHVIFDGWSFGVLQKELAALYEAFSSGKPSPLPELAIQYGDYAVWQRGWLQGEVLEEQIAYWKGQLAGAPAVLELPTDRPRPPAQSFAGRILSLTLPRALLDSLRSLSRHEGVTLFMTLLAAFKLLLARYSGQQDIVVGSPIANRTRVEVEGLIGFFVNTLVLRTDLSGNPTFRELLVRVREVTLGAYAHQDLPFEKLVEELRPERDLSHTPLFQVLFVLQNALMPPLELAGLALRPLPIGRETSLFDLSLYLQESEAGLQAALEYNTDLFEAATVERLWAHYQTLLREIVSHPEVRLGDLRMLPEAERRRLLVEWNDTQAEYPRELSLHQLFELQVERTPEVVAVIYEGERLSYRELNARANHLAHHLRALGVGPEVLVGLCLERSVEMVVALLGILKAGGAYVPLDPEFPRERIAFMLADSAAPLLVTQQSLLPELPAHAARVLCLDADWGDIARESSDNPLPQGNADHLAYVLYTSGSTGQPKGVQIPHRAVVNFLSSMQQQPGIRAEDVLLAVTTLSFDIAGLELYLPLTVGARVVIASREVTSDGRTLADAIQGCAATLMQATPATWQLLLAAGWQGNPRLTALCGGEALPLDLAQQLLSRCAALWNLYGPTETTIWSTVARVTATQEKISIGRPIANTEIYILDGQQQPVPVGVPGELYIGGDGLARGYLHRPELTAEKFIGHPFSSEQGARLYKTGDLARYWPDGRIEHLGRLDFQVKLRGFRIELGEIEAVLRQHEAVAEAVVVAREDKAGDKRLVAYVVAQAQGEPGFGEMRNFLREKLPDYMVPSSFVRLEAFPLTPNGKVDRRALPAPEGLQLIHGHGFVGPRTPMEGLMAGIWADLLSVERVGIHDNFFDLGGHSLLSMRVVYELEKRTGLHISPRELIFETLEQIAAGCETMKKPAPKVETVGITHKLFGALKGAFSGPNDVLKHDE